MNTISQNKRYYPHDLNTKYYSVKLYRSGEPIRFVCRRYKISKASLMRWNKIFDGTKESLIDKSHKPNTPHPNAHTKLELKWIKDYLRRNPNISMIELYGKLKIDEGYSRHACSLFRILRKLGHYKQKQHKYIKYSPKPYDTPKYLGIKWQLDVKYVNEYCYVADIPDKFYQYTVIDEASRERFIYPYREQSSYSTVYFGYTPKTIQTDNGQEFTHLKNTKLIHLFDQFCNENNIIHQLIRPRTPRHNGKVERSHRNDSERFYRYLSFYSYDDLKIQMKAYLKRSNNIPMQTLNWLSPKQIRISLLPDRANA